LKRRARPTSNFTTPKFIKLHRVPRRSPGSL
jgi:hypothetical protein